MAGGAGLILSIWFIVSAILSNGDTVGSLSKWSFLRLLDMMDKLDMQNQRISYFSKSTR